MTQIIRKLYLTVPLLWSILFYSSCLKEDMDGCETTVDPIEKTLWLSFSFPEWDGTEGFKPEELELLSVYAFDQNGLFMTKWDDGMPKLSDPEYGMLIPLNRDYKTFVVWGNLAGDYITEPKVLESGKTHFDEAFVHFKHESDTVTKGPLPLFWGMANNISNKGRNEESDTIPLTVQLIKNTYTIHVRAWGIKSNENNYQVSITDTNDRYRLDNSFAYSEKFHYTRKLEQQSNETFTASIPVLRLDWSRSPVFEIHSIQTKQSIETDLKELLLLLQEKEGKAIDLTRRYNFDIDLYFSTKDGKIMVSMYVDGWYLWDREVLL